MLTLTGSTSSVPPKSFHPKAYIFRGLPGGTAFVGSSNLSEGALTTSIEWNYRVISSQNGPGVADTQTTFFDNYRRPEWNKDGDDWHACVRRCDGSIEVNFPFVGTTFSPTSRG